MATEEHRMQMDFMEFGLQANPGLYASLPDEVQTKRQSIHKYRNAIRDALGVLRTQLQLIQERQQRQGETP